MSLVSLILIYSIIWWAFDGFFERPDNIRYSIVNENSRGYIDDLKYSIRLQVQGQSFFSNENIIYSYGPSGLVIINLKSKDIRVYFDEKTNLSLKEELVRASTKKIEEGGVEKEYLQIVAYDDLTERERDIYIILKERKDKYPYWQIIDYNGLE